MSQTIVLITGTNRGIGKGIIQRYLTKPNHVVIAANRDPEHLTSKALFDLPQASSTRLIVVKIDASKESDPFAAVKELQAQGIDHLDVVIANAGVSYIWPKVSDVKIADLQGHIDVNVHGMVWLYQATLPLLQKSSDAKFAYIGSTAGWIEVIVLPISLSGYVLIVLQGQLSVPNAAYGPSKSAAHWLVKRIDAEEPGLSSFVVHPGWVRTDLGNAGARSFGLEQAPDDVEATCAGIVEVVEKSTKTDYGGRSWSYTGEFMHW